MKCRQKQLEPKFCWFQRLGFNFIWLCTLQLYITDNFQVVKGNQLRKKIIHISQGFYRFRFLLHRYYFSISLTNCIYLVGYAKRMLYFEQPTVLLARNHLNTMLLTNFEHLIFISNIFQFRTFLSFDGPSNYLYLFKKHRQTFPGSEERPSSHLKVTKM